MDMTAPQAFLITAIAITSLLAYFFDRRQRMTANHRNVLGGAIMALLFLVSQVLPGLLFGKPTMGELIGYLLAYFGLWLILFHHLAYIFGGEITRLRDGSKAWVEAIDYVYLLFGFVGIFKIIVSETGHPTDAIDRWAPWLLGLAIALRVTRTSIKIWAWDEVTKDEETPPANM